MTVAPNQQDDHNNLHHVNNPTPPPPQKKTTPCPAGCTDRGVGVGIARQHQRLCGPRRNRRLGVHVDRPRKVALRRLAAAAAATTRHVQRAPSHRNQATRQRHAQAGSNAEAVSTAWSRVDATAATATATATAAACG